GNEDMQITQLDATADPVVPAHGNRPLSKAANPMQDNSTFQLRREWATLPSLNRSSNVDRAKARTAADGGDHDDCATVFHHDGRGRVLQSRCRAPAVGAILSAAPDQNHR